MSVECRSGGNGAQRKSKSGGGGVQGCNKVTEPAARHCTPLHPRCIIWLSSGIEARRRAPLHQARRGSGAGTQRLLAALV
jgi:hypothetical protein